MEIATNSRIRLQHGLTTGSINELGCDQCIVQFDSKIFGWIYETNIYIVDKSELREPILTTLTNLRDKLEVKLIDFMADESGKSTLKVIGGILAGSIITIIAALIFK